MKKSLPVVKAKLLKTLSELAINSVLEAKTIKKKITEKENQLDQLEERYVTGELNPDLYEKYSKRFRQDLEALKKLLPDFTMEGSNLKLAVEKTLKIAENISQLWVSASFEDKQHLQKLVFS